jgi:hypothetical protein
MGGTGSDFEVFEAETAQEAAEKCAEKLFENHLREHDLEYAEWQTIVIEGATPESSEVEDLSAQFYSERLAKEVEDNRLEQLRLAEESARKKEIARQRKIEAEQAEFERLRQLYG